MIDSVQNDPLGIGKVTPKTDCAKVGSPNGFHFIVIQSSAGEDGIGVNRMNARDFFENVVHEKGTDLQVIAQSICSAKQNKKSDLSVTRIVRTENGATKAVFALLRHRTLQGEVIPSCLIKPVALEHSACVQSCLKFLR